jgi:hypothetical protein
MGVGMLGDLLTIFVARELHTCAYAWAWVSNAHCNSLTHLIYADTYLCQRQLQRTSLLDSAPRGACARHVQLMITHAFHVHLI